MHLTGEGKQGGEKREGIDGDGDGDETKRKREFMARRGEPRSEAATNKIGGGGAWVVDAMVPFL